MKKAKKAKVVKNENGEVVEKKKKGGKKKLLLIPIALILLAAIAAAVVFFVLPRFGIHLLDGGDGDTSSVKVKEETLPKKGLQEYTVGENTVASLDTILVEGEGELMAMRTPGKKKGDVEDKFTYIYELTTFAPVVDRYVSLLMSGEQKFVMTDETYLVQEERPEFQDADGAVLLVCPAVEEGRLFQLAIGWSQASNNLVVRVAAPEGSIRYPKKEEAGKQPEPSSVSMQMEQLRSMPPAQLGLPGDSMDQYTIFPVDGFVKVDGRDCRRFNVYDASDPGSIIGTYLFSTDQEHIYVLDNTTNTVSTIR